jgi:hypothetical protein
MTMNGGNYRFSEAENKMAEDVVQILFEATDEELPAQQDSYG